MTRMLIELRIASVRSLMRREAGTPHERQHTTGIEQVFRAAIAFCFGAVPVSPVHRDMDRNDRRECWNLDVQRRRRLADDRSDAQSVDGLAGSEREQSS